MNFKAKLIGYSAAASIALAYSPVLIAEPITLDYASVAHDSDRAKALWGDILPNVEMQGDQPPTIFVADAGEGIEVTLMYASNQCSMDKCPIRVFSNGEKIEDTMGCYNVTEHQIAESRSAMTACDEVIVFSRK